MKFDEPLLTATSWKRLRLRLEARVMQIGGLASFYVELARLRGAELIGGPCDARLLISDEVDAFLLSLGKLFILSELLDFMSAMLLCLRIVPLGCSFCGRIERDPSNPDSGNQRLNEEYFSRLYEWRLNLKSRAVTGKYLTGTDVALEFPVINDKYVGLLWNIQKFGYWLFRVADPKPNFRGASGT